MSRTEDDFTATSAGTARDSAPQRISVARSAVGQPEDVISA